MILDIREIQRESHYKGLYRAISAPVEPYNAYFMDNSAENELAQLKLQLNSITQLYPVSVSPYRIAMLSIPKCYPHAAESHQPSPII